MINGRMLLPNKRQQQMPRKSSTNTRALSTRISNLQREVLPILTAGPLRNAPVAKTLASRIWVPRTVKVTLSSNTEAILTTGLVVGALGSSGTTAVNFKVLKLKVWNFTNQGASTNYVSMTTDSLITTSGLTTTAEDFGCSNSLPGVHVNVPDVLAKSYDNASASGSARLCTVTGIRTGLTGGTQNFIIEAQLMVQA
jgi:hypothetical protein